MAEGFYPKGGNEPLHMVLLGDRIEHKLMPGFVMTVRDIEPCQASPGRDEPHSQFQITDPDGNTDWLCAYDVRRAT
jgi:hypothetical protein